MSKYVPGRCDIVWVDLNPQKGREQAKRRPFLTLSPREYNIKSGLFIGCPITSKIKGYPFEVQVNQSKVGGAILADQIKSLDWKERNTAFITTIDSDTANAVTELVKLLIEG